MNSKPIAQLERESKDAEEALAKAKETQRTLRDAVMGAVFCTGSQYHNHTIPRGIGKSTILLDAAHLWALQAPRSYKDGDTIAKTKLVVYAARNGKERNNVLATKLGGEYYYVSTQVLVITPTDLESKLGAALLGHRYEEALIVVDEPTDFKALMDILTVVMPRINPKNVTTISLSSNHSE